MKDSKIVAVRVVLSVRKPDGYIEEQEVFFRGTLEEGQSISLEQEREIQPRYADGKFEPVGFRATGRESLKINFLGEGKDL